MTPNVGKASPYYTGGGAFASQPVLQVDKGGGSGADGKVLRFHSALINGQECRDVMITIDLGKVVGFSYKDAKGKVVQVAPLLIATIGVANAVAVPSAGPKKPVTPSAFSLGASPVINYTLHPTLLAQPAHGVQATGPKPPVAATSQGLFELPKPQGATLGADEPDDGMDSVLGKLDLLSLFADNNAKHQPAKPPGPALKGPGMIWDDEPDEDTDDGRSECPGSDD